jgi:hypothetical protein
LSRLAKAAAVAAALGLAVPTVALAQSDFSSTQTASLHFTPDQVAAFSKQIETDLAGRGARVAMVFRLGRPHDKMPPGINYTHGAFWVYRDIQTAAGVQHGYAVYNLFSGDGKAWPATQSRQIQDYPFEFTRGSAVDDVAVIVPSPEMQRRILAVIDSPTYEALHNPSYSLIANPLRDKHQNCNSFMLDVVASAAWDTTDPRQIRADEKAHYEPSVVRASPLMRFFAPMADARLKTDDQSGEIVTATYESIAAFMKANGLLESTYAITFAR